MMTTTTLYKPSRWGKQPYELARRVASEWGTPKPAEAARAREGHTERPSGRVAKARGYQQKILILSAESALVEVALERTHEQPKEPLETTFRALKEKWIADTAFASATVDIVLNDAYQQIIGLGPAALPLIIRELDQNGGQWFWALRMITRQDPVPKELRGKTRRMAEVWINWAKERNII